MLGSYWPKRDVNYPTLRHASKTLIIKRKNQVDAFRIRCEPKRVLKIVVTYTYSATRKDTTRPSTGYTRNDEAVARQA